MNYEERIKGILKCYLLMRKGEWFYASELSDYLQINKCYFKLGNYGKLTPRDIGYLLNKYYFDDIEFKYEGTKKKYRMR